MRCNAFAPVMRWKLNDVRFFDNIDCKEGTWKSRIQHLYLGCDGSKWSHFGFLPKLKTLELGYDYNNALDVSRTPELVHLKLSELLTHSIDLNKLPHLIVLRTGYAFNQSFTCKMIHLQELYLRRYTQKIDWNLFPKLRVLHLGDKYNHSISKYQFPYLEELHLSNAYNHPLDLSHVPNLNVLWVGHKQQHSIIINSRVQVTCRRELEEREWYGLKTHQSLWNLERNLIKYK